MSAATTKRGPGRPPSEKDATGKPARLRLSWVTSQQRAECELFGDEAPALRLLAAWARNDCTPKTLRIDRKTVQGWAPI